jgi:hypothetical protein
VQGELAQELARELGQAGHGKKETVLLRWADATGLSRSTLLRRAREGGYKAQARKRRTDAGQPRSGVTAQGIEYLVALMKGSHRKTGAIEMPTTVALEITQRAGLIGRDVTVSTIRRHLREQGLSRRQLQSGYTTDSQTVSAHHVRLTTAHPNAMHQVDVSACLHWYFKTKGGLAYKHQKLDLAGGKKAGPYQQLREHILRYLMVDHKSGAFYMRYYLAAGESALNLIDFMYHAWSRRPEPRDIFHGAPILLYMDKGSANLSHLVTLLLDNLQIDYKAHEAGVARASGMVERYHGIWQQQFESRLWLDPPRDLAELNARADDFRVHYCETQRNRGTGCTRWQAWLAIKDEQLRRMPPREVFNELVHEKPHKTKARGDKTITYKGACHLILDPINLGESVEVVRNPYKLPELLIYRLDADGSRGDLLNTRYLADPAEIAVPVGQYRRHADTPAQKAMKKADELDLGPVQAAAFGGYQKELPQNVTHLEKRGQEILAAQEAQHDAQNDAQAGAGPGPQAQPEPDPLRRLRVAGSEPEKDPLPRPAYFNNEEHHYRWVQKRLAHGLEVSRADQDQARQFEQTALYQSMSPEFWRNDAEDISLAV